MEPHRKRIRHFHAPGDFHELTFSCFERSRLLTNHLWRQLLCQAIDRAISSHQFGLVAFVLMPEHVHLLVDSGGQAARTLAGQGPQSRPTPVRAHSTQSTVARLSRLLADIKRPYSGRIRKILLKDHDPLLSSLTVMERPGKLAFRFWQEGPGYDRNLSSKKSVLAAIDYIHLNPVRRGLAARAVDWKWSSARWYVSDGNDCDPDLPTIHGPPAGFFD
ncbi:MAG TPA: transposase [Planctomycetaceae bacterium]|jgi:putative transposase|nr:transposase [Planctomycetaceae bacterium]